MTLLDEGMMYMQQFHILEAEVNIWLFIYSVTN